MTFAAQYVLTNKSGMSSTFFAFFFWFFLLGRCPCRHLYVFGLLLAIETSSWNPYKADKARMLLIWNLRWWILSKISTAAKRDINESYSAAAYINYCILGSFRRLPAHFGQFFWSFISLQRGMKVSTDVKLRYQQPLTGRSQEKKLISALLVFWSRSQIVNFIHLFALHSREHSSWALLQILQFDLLTWDGRYIWSHGGHRACSPQSCSWESHPPCSTFCTS